MTFEGRRVGVLVPTYNEGTQIRKVIDSMPDYVDTVVVVDDASTDETASIVEECALIDERVVFLPLEHNVGVGGALSVAYRWARDHGIDIAVSVDGDGQMDATEIRHLIEPICRGEADYAKGNRLWNPGYWRLFPRIRLLGNAVLSLLTKMASGYWGVIDSQSGFSAANRFALERIDWDSMYARYGRPNDVLVLANVAECRVVDVPVTPIYGVGERSSMKIARVIFTISMLLFRRFWWRLLHKYVLRDFHPLVFFYLLATVTSVTSVGLAIRLVVAWSVNGYVPATTALALSFFAITTLNALFFAYWMDMQANAHLMVKISADRRSGLSSPDHAA